MADQPSGGTPLRVIIEGVTPQIDGGRFPIKRTVGETVIVAADIFVEGHDQVSAVLRYRHVEPCSPERAAEWCETAMEDLGNDRWSAWFTVERLGRYEFTVQGWVDLFASWTKALNVKVGAGQDVESELSEGAELVLDTAQRLAAVARGAGRARAGSPRKIRSVDADALAARDWLLAQAHVLGGSDDQAVRVEAGLSPDLGRVMNRYEDRSAATTVEPPLAVEVDRERARFGAWYEMFPRSAGPDPSRSATFTEASGRLPDIAAMGFDVLYLPPIHPIGRSFRKGPNNTLAAGPHDPGSPWAIGSPEGGHKSVEPGLGSLEDFDRFVETAARFGLEIALDIAFQCSPDHPYVREHPQWFRHRPDGTIKYAENPPKKYQDIYPLDFGTPDWQALWQELKSVFLFWVAHGVTIFRVDNPHTKPFRFWECVIGEVRREHPETIFLSEAFTRPKVMRYLAKLGFTQSYTYFTWRNTKAELIEYFTELTQTDVREYLRPNLFANTPDILHEYLQTGGPPAFQARLLLAATLGASYGIYSGFEVCENRPVRAGSEEYLDSEKYQFRQWDWDRPGNMTELIARVNQIRHSHAAVQLDWSLRFHDTDNDQLICYSKEAPGADHALVVIVNLDPHHMQHGWVRIPVARLNLPADDAYEMQDLLTGERYYWRGERNYVRLEPGFQAGHILKVNTTGPRTSPGVDA